MLVRMWSNRNSNLFGGENAKWYSHFGSSYKIKVSCKAKHILTIWSGNCAPLYTPKWVENIYPKTSTCMLIVVLFTIPKIKMSIVKWMDKSTVVYPGSGILLSNKIVKPWNFCTLLSERNILEKATHCMIRTIWHSGKYNIMEIVKRSMVARYSGEVGLNRWYTENF